METYKGYQIKKSGKYLYKVIEPADARPFFHRFVSIAAAKVEIDCRLDGGRVMTPAEHRIVYPEA